MRSQTSASECLRKQHPARSAWSSRVDDSSKAVMGKLQPTRCELGRQLWAAIRDPVNSPHGQARHVRCHVAAEAGVAREGSLGIHLLCQAE